MRGTFAQEDALELGAADAPASPWWWRWLVALGTFARRKPLGAFGGVLLIATIVIAILSPVIATFDYREPHFSDSLVDPNSTYYFGTDSLGRDFFSRMVIGTQATIMVGLGTVLLAAVISLIVGGLSGYLGGRFDMIVQRIVDVWVALPAIFLLLTFVAVLGTGGDGFLGIGRGPDVGLNPRDGDWIWHTFFRTTVVIFSLGIIFAGYGSRVVRSVVLTTKANVYVDAAHALGATNLRIMVRHVLPNIVPVLIILATLNLGTAVLVEATISFLGFGIAQPFPTWGQLLATDGRLHGPGHEYLMFIPGAAIFICVYGFNMLGDALRDVLDPRLRGG